MSAATEAELLPQKPLNELFSHMPTTVFEVMSKLAMEHSSVNLGQVSVVSPLHSTRQLARTAPSINQLLATASHSCLDAVHDGPCYPCVRERAEPGFHGIAGMGSGHVWLNTWAANVAPRRSAAAARCMRWC